MILGIETCNDTNKTLEVRKQKESVRISGKQPKQEQEKQNKETKSREQAILCPPVTGGGNQNTALTPYE